MPLLLLPWPLLAPAAVGRCHERLPEPVALPAASAVADRCWVSLPGTWWSCCARDDGARDDLQRRARRPWCSRDGNAGDGRFPRGEKGELSLSEHDSPYPSTELQNSRHL